MKPLEHTTAKASYYNARAHSYDAFNENNSKATNTLLEKILKEHNISTVLDLTCCTGSQVFWLQESGFEVVGSDISNSMLKIAKQKAKLKNLKIKFLQGDCRNVHAGSFDAVITIFNAIGHLSREDFKLTIQNIYRNLNSSGLYIFDIINLDYLKFENNITKLTGDWMAISEGNKVREIQFSTISDDGVLASYSTYVHQGDHLGLTKISKGYRNTLQVYSADELKSLLEENGFVVLNQADMNGEAFSKNHTERILTIVKKV